MDVHVTLSGGARLGATVYQQLREAILDGRLRPGDSLPASREMARRLAVSRNTVTGAYRRLVAEGFANGRAGAGTFVSGEGPSTARSRRAPTGAGLAPRAAWKSLTSVVERPAATAPFDFRIGVPDAGLFPWDAWRRLVGRELRLAARSGPARYAEPEGHRGLREAIGRHAGVARSVRAGPDDVLVTSGAQQALDLIARILVEPGTTVAVEDPGYPPARRLFESYGARVVPVPVDEEGLVVDALPANARLVYVTPSHQFPLGTAMSLPRRLALLAWAERHGAAILEDDYDSELRFDGRPLEPLQSLDRGGRVLYVGTFSKTLLPSLRIGFVVAPSSLLPALRAARALADWHGPTETQAALARLIDEGLLARHVRRALRIYRERRERLLESLRRRFAGVLTPVPSSAGLHVTALFDDARLDDRALARRALASKVAVEPLRPYYEENPRPGLAFGFGAIPLSRIDDGLRRLAACLDAPVSSGRGR